jgi:hypothetical protein
MDNFIVHFVDGFSHLYVPFTWYENPSQGPRPNDCRAGLCHLAPLRDDARAGLSGSDLILTELTGGGGVFVPLHPSMD